MRVMPTKVVGVYESLKVKDLLSLLRTGHSVSHEGAGTIRIFTPSMERHNVALAWSECKGGRFVVRGTTKSA